MRIADVIRQIESDFDNMSIADAAWCREQLRRVALRKKENKPVSRELIRIRARAERSQLQVAQRRAAVPQPAYDEALPITAHREEIIRSVLEHQVVVVAGETGSGKTTQLPKFCLEAGFGTRGQIACTQPRRIAASAMAQRLAEELQVELGTMVGYQVRFRDRSGPDSLIKFMTDGILLAETTRDRRLSAYDLIIIDEAHERSLNIDFLLGYLKTLLPERPDLKLVITSATIDTEKFSAHFDGAPVIEVSGRSYPVEIVYLPFDDGEQNAESTERDLYQGIADAVRRVDSVDRHGDILVFLSGEREIREAGNFLAKQHLRHSEILPLYARLSTAEQQRVFHPGPHRRIILSTNLAETSLTVPRIRFVIDSGLARISRYAHRSRIQRLPIEAISRASANQRSGRCGRLGPGICIRLYSEDDFNRRPEFTEPEILRTSLGSVVLRMLVMGLGAVEDFPFLDSPAPRMINDAYQLLFELGAIDEQRKPTARGRALDQWPLDVRLARMVVAGNELGCLEDLMVIAAALSIQDPRERPLDRQQAADQSHHRFADDRSDFSGLLRLWTHLRDRRREVSGNQFRKLCSREFFNWQRVLEWFDLYQQLRDQARESGYGLSGKHGGYDAIHRSVLTGLLSHIGLRHPEDRSYQGARSRSFHLFPGSGLFGRNPKWVMAAEIVETTRAWGRTSAEIKPEWIELHGAHLLKFHQFDPHWARRSGAVMAWQQVSLFGLVVVERRRVHYARFDPAGARRIFIMEALVRGELDTRAAFMDHNRKVREEVELLEHKRRRRDVLVDEHTQFEFFDARIPDDVNSAQTFEQWLARIGEAGRKTLLMGHDVLMRQAAAASPEELFPDVLQVGPHHFSLSYVFEPGNERDGVSIEVPLELLNTLSAGQLQWLVPGLLREKLIALIKALPKARRRALIPVPVFAEALEEALHATHASSRPGSAGAKGTFGSLHQACAAELGRITGLPIDAGEFDETALPAHLLFRIQVLDGQGKEIASGRKLDELKNQLGLAAQRRFMNRQGAGYNRDGATGWEFGRLEQQCVTAGGAVAWPALVDQKTAAGLRLFDTPEEASLAHGDGVLRLLALNLADKFEFLRKHPGLSRESLMAWTPLGSTDGLIEDLVWCSLQRAAGDVTATRDEQAFKRLHHAVRSRMGAVCRRLADLLNEILPACSRIGRELQGTMESRHPDAVQDMSWQLDDLVHEGFLSQLSPGRLDHYPRYLAALEMRLLALEENPLRDGQRLNLVKPWWRLYLDRLDSGGIYDEALDDYRWLIEEYRVSVFAQGLGTHGKVSPKRLQAAWQKVLGPA